MSETPIEPHKTPQQRRREAFEKPIGNSEINRLPKKERLARLSALRKAGLLSLATPTDRIPPLVMERIRMVLAAIRGGAEIGEAVSVAGVAFSTVSRWRRRYPRYLEMEQAAIVERDEAWKAATAKAWRERAIEGVPSAVKKRYAKDGHLISEEQVIQRSDALLIKLIERFWPELRRNSATSVSVTMNTAEERHEVLVLFSDPDLRAALDRAQDRAALPSGEPGDAGGADDGELPA